MLLPRIGRIPDFKSARPGDEKAQITMAFRFGASQGAVGGASPLSPTGAKPFKPRLPCSYFQSGSRPHYELHSETFCDILTRHMLQRRSMHVRAPAPNTHTVFLYYFDAFISYSHDPATPYKKSHCNHYAAGCCKLQALQPPAFLGPPAFHTRDVMIRRQGSCLHLHSRPLARSPP